MAARALCTYQRKEGGVEAGGSIGVYRVGLVAALHPPLVSHPPFNFAPGCTNGPKDWVQKMVLTSLHPIDTPPYLMNIINLIVVA